MPATLNTGPPPKDPEKRVRRNKPATTPVQLPAEGYKGPIPDWPYGARMPSETALEVWDEFWRTPQAAMWIKQGILVQHEVARYVYLLVDATLATADAERRQLGDRLGMYPLSLRRLGWEIARQDIGEELPEPARANNRYAGLRAVARPE